MPITPPPPMSERMRKRRAFADRDLDAVMFQREQQAAEMQRLTGNGGQTPSPIPHPPCWNALHPIRFHVLPFQPQLFQQIQHHHSIHLPVIKMETNQIDDEDSDIEVDVTSNPPSPPPSSIVTNKLNNNNVAINKSKISFSVESIIGRP